MTGKTGNETRDKGMEKKKVRANRMVWMNGDLDLDLDLNLNKGWLLKGPGDTSMGM